MEINARLQVLVAGEASPRMKELLNSALQNVPHAYVQSLQALRPGAVLFAAAIGQTGINLPLYALIAEMRAANCLEHCVAGAIIDGESELFTKTVATQLLQSANMAGCLLPGKPLVEGTGSLKNFSVLAGIQNTDKWSAYVEAARELVLRVLNYKKPALARPGLLVLHASNRKTSNTLMLWGLIRKHLEAAMDIQEIPLRNGTVADCEGCAYTTCLHLGEQGQCFYGGVMVEEVYPALQSCNALMLLCPNYNDAVDANITAFINRMTALFRATRFYNKSLFAIVVSGYSGGDIVARQLISGLNINKTFQLPPRFCMMETANAPGSVLQIEKIESKAEEFAGAIKKHLL